ncbi:MAG: HEAT repeat domain-containing protein [Fimbriimonadaceae bacterium]
MAYRALLAVAGIVALTFSASSFSSAQLTDAEMSALENTLFIGNMNLDDLKFERNIYQDRYRLPIIDQAIEDPIAAANNLMSFHASMKGQSLSQSLRIINEQIYDNRPTTPIVEVPPVRMPANVPQAYARPLERLLNALRAANARVRAAYALLSEEEKQALISSIGPWAAETDKVTFDYGSGVRLSQEEILSLIDKVDLAAIRAAAAVLATEVEAVIPELSFVRGQVSQSQFFTIEGTVVSIGGYGNDIHTRGDAAIVIDFGGNDTYLGRQGVGVGYCAIHIDLGGDDRYDVPDAGVGVGILGVGLAWNIGGNDSFRGGNVNYGAGLAGVGGFYKEGGNDFYSMGAMGQGYGVFGVGVLSDSAGNDVYNAKLYAQGASRTQGVGWLIDQRGNDIYKCGGLVVHEPLFSDVHYSFAQGFSSGFREDTGGLSGGLGMITDFMGDDTYIAETYAQAASYWYAVGSMYDEIGNDNRFGYHYVQASAMHLCAAYLFDLDGDDSYTANFGAAHAIGHDYAVAFLLDRAGNDIYAARDSRPGMGNANGLGIFIDAGGEDRYQGPPGIGNPSRGTGSLGVFVDISGPDKYQDGLNNDQASLRTTWGVSYDIFTPNVQPLQAQVLPSPQPGSLPMPGDAQMAELYRQASQWGVGTAEAEVSSAVNQLIGIGLPALDWMIRNRLASTDRLGQRAFVAVISGIGEPAFDRFAPEVGSDNVDIARNALAIAMEANITQAAPLVAKQLKVVEVQRIAVRAAGALGSKESVPVLIEFVEADDPILSLNALIALSEIGDERSLETAQPLLTSENLQVRMAAINLFSRFPVQGGEAAAELVKSEDERTARIGVLLYGEIGSPEALNIIAGFLTDPRPGMRITAAQNLAGRCPADARENFNDLRQDPDQRVRAVMARLSAEPEPAPTEG